jgi:hypothetical protein
MPRTCSQVPETLCKQSSAPKHPRFHGTDRHIEYLSSLLEGKPLEIDQDDGRSELDRQITQGFLDVRS